MFIAGAELTILGSRGQCANHCAEIKYWRVYFSYLNTINIYDEFQHGQNCVSAIGTPCLSANIVTHKEIQVVSRDQLSERVGSLTRRSVPVNRIWWNLTGSKILTSSTKSVFFGLIGKTRWPHWPLIGWDIFDFSSKSTKRNSTKLNRKEDINVLYQVCGVFFADRKKDGRPGLWLAETFSTSPLKQLNGIQRNLTGRRSQCPLLSLCFSGRSKKQDGNTAIILASDWLRYY